MTNPMIEKAARAIHDGPLAAGDYAFDGPGENEQECSAWCREVARAVLTALLEPTPAMIDAAEVILEGREFCADPSDRGFVNHIWQAMLSAALNEGEG